MKINYEDVGFYDGINKLNKRMLDNKEYLRGYKLGLEAVNQKPIVTNGEKFVSMGKEYQRLNLDV